jgi:hypothetical protein
VVSGRAAAERRSRPLARCAPALLTPLVKAAAG